MDTKKIIYGLVGGAVAGYVYYNFVAKKPQVKTVSEGVSEEVGEESEEGELKSIGGGGGGGFMPTESTPTTNDSGTTTTGTTTTGTTTTETTKPLKPAISPIREETGTIAIKPSGSLLDSYTKPTTTTTYTKPALTTNVSIKEAYTKTLTSKFSGMGGEVWDADVDNLDI